MDDDCSEQFTHIPCSRQITNGRWMFKAVILYSAFEQNYNGAVTCPKYSAHIHPTTTFKKFSDSSTEVKTPNETGRQGRVWVSLCLHLAPCLRKSNFFVGSISGCTHLLRRSKPSLSFVGYLQRVAWLLCQMYPHTCLSAEVLFRDNHTEPQLKTEPPS